MRVYLWIFAYFLRSFLTVDIFYFFSPFREVDTLLSNPLFSFPSVTNPDFTLSNPDSPPNGTSS